MGHGLGIEFAGAPPRDDAAIAEWRNHLRHRKAQALGRGGMFADYRLRIAEVVRDYGPNDRAQAPADTEAAFAS